MISLRGPVCLMFDVEVVRWYMRLRKQANGSVEMWKQCSCHYVQQHIISLWISAV